MCLLWQVAIVHNVLMLTKCQFDPWDRRVGRRCGSWILKRATARCSCGDGRRRDTDETSNYLPNGRQIQGGKEGWGGGWRGRKTAGKDRWRRERRVGKRRKRCWVYLLQVSVFCKTKIFGKRVSIQSNIQSHNSGITQWQCSCIRSWSIDTLTSDLLTHIITTLALKPSDWKALTLLNE